MKLRYHQIAFIVLPPVLLISMMACFGLLSKPPGLKGGYLAGFIIYRIFWCGLVPYFLPGASGIRKVLRKMLRKVPDRDDIWYGSRQIPFYLLDSYWAHAV